MNKLIGLLTVFFAICTGQVFAQDVNNLLDIFQKQAHHKIIEWPKDVEQKSFEFVPIITAEQASSGGIVFDMGSEEGKEEEKPVHKVRLTKPFEIQKTEVTQLQYEIIMGNNTSSFRIKGETYNRPVENLSYEDTQKFISALNTIDPVYHYRLPTEAEWEYAAGEKPTSLIDHAWYGDNSSDKSNPDGRTYDVATKKANNFGLYDMFGNVWEWVSDYYDSKYYSQLSDKLIKEQEQNPDKKCEILNPQGPDPDADHTDHGLRGSCFIGDSTTCRASLRFLGWPPDQNYGRGFRLVRSAK